jgi:hypothetical protein
MGELNNIVLATPVLYFGITVPVLVIMLLIARWFDDRG